MNLIEAFVQNPVKVTVGVMLVVLFGIVSLLSMPMQLTPEVQIPTINVTTIWPGASPFEVEREITQEQEQQLQSVEGVTKLSSQSMDSQAQITLEFRVGMNMEEALLKVNSRLQQVREYPQDADEPVISTSSPADRPIAWFIMSPRMPDAKAFDEFEQAHPELVEPLRRVRSAPNPTLALFRLQQVVEKHPLAAELLPARRDVTTLRKFVEDVIEARFERVDGVANSDVFGGREQELHVIVDPAQLAARGLTILDLRQSLIGQNSDISGGDVWEEKRRYVVRTMGRFTSEQQVLDHVLAIRAGAPVYVRDVARVELGYKRPQGVVRRFGIPCISVNAKREVGANVLDVMKGLQQAAQELNAGPLLKEGLELTQVYDETEYIYSAIGLVNSNIVSGGILTVLTLLAFLRSGRTTVVIALAIPTSIIGTFLVLAVLGRSLNVISLAGLSFAVGMLVDNAIVVLENVYRHYQLGLNPRAAAIRGTQEVWGAVVASTLTTLAVFVPVVFVQEEAGQLFRDISLAISAAVGLSMIVSVVVIPTAATRILRNEKRDGVSELGTMRRDPSRLQRFWEPWIDAVDRSAAASVKALLGFNQWIARSVVRQIGLILLLMAVSIGGTWLAWPKVEYLPAGNRNLVFAILLPPPGYNLEQLMKLGSDVETFLQPYWDLDPDDPNIDKLEYPAIRDFFYVAAGRSVFMGLRSYDETRAGKLVDLMRTVRATVPGTFAVANQSSLFEQEIGAGRGINVEVSGPELEQLYGLGGRMMGMMMKEIPQAQIRPIPSLDITTPELRFYPHSETQQELGYTIRDVGYVINALVDGAYATDYFRDGNKLDLTILGSDRNLNHTQDVERLPVATPTGQVVPLATIAEAKLLTGPEQINRRERQRAITLQVSPPADMPTETALELVQERVIEPLRQEGALGGGYNVFLSGTADKLRETWISLRWNLLLALLITYLLMAALFESWIFPLVIIVSVPLGAVGGVLGLKLLGYYLIWQDFPPQALDVLTMLGFVILIGTVVNNAILIVHQSLNLIRDEGYAPNAAMLESVRTRTRPIFMTTGTTVLGLLPLVLYPGAGSELYRGLGSIVLGGLLVSTFFTLILIPAFFTLVMRWIPTEMLMVEKMDYAPQTTLTPAADTADEDEQVPLLDR